MSPDYFAYNQYRDFLIYKELEKFETVPEFKKVLQELIKQEWEDFEFWKNLSTKKDFRVSHLSLWRYRLMRRFLGLTFTARFLERHEKEMIDHYTDYARTASPELQKKIKEIIEHEHYHENQLISQIKEDKVEFMGSIILGLNDGLIELTGALVGFSFALQNPVAVALTGTITGFAASLSMSASAYLQAQYEPGKDPYKSAFYTGIAYLLVVVLLITPFILLGSIYKALFSVAIIIVAIISSVSFYSSIIFKRPLGKQLRQMLLLSVGVAIITFALGSVLKQFTGIEL
ncbi:MAG: VIT1/CCC1 transporter family protein [Anaplasmataceae bacterium]|nr:VIT1/CCC1 transporter family protein [Anaplasmataceae bacterium]